MCRYFKFLSLIFFVLIMCGCSNKLTCIKEEKYEKNKIVVKFKDDKPNSLKWNTTFIFDKFDAYIDLKYLELKNDYALLDPYNGIEYDIKNKDKEGFIYIKVNIDFENYNEIDIFPLPINMENLESNKANLENDGYICK